MIKADRDLFFRQERFLLEDASLSNRAKNALINAGYQTVEECQNLSQQDLYSMRNIGRKTVEEIQGLLEDFKRKRESLRAEDILESNDDILKNRQDYLIKVL